MTQPTAKDLHLEWQAEIVRTFIEKHYGNDDDPTLPRIWAWACLMEHAADIGLAMIVDAVDVQGYTHADIAQALGVTRQAVQQRLLRQRVKGVNKYAPGKQTEQLPLL